MRIAQRVGCTAERAWTACADPRGIRQWQADVATGNVADGGHLELGYPALGVTIELEVVAAQPPRQLVLASGDSRVTFLVEPGLVTVEHSGLPAGDELEGTESAWRVTLALLAHYLEFHPERDRQAHWVVRRTKTSAAAAAEFFARKEALGTWLGRAPASLGEDGSRYTLATLWGEPMSGRVLSRVPGRDLALSWEEQDNSALVLRTLPSPFADGERVIAACWSRWSERPAPEATLRGLQAAMTQLARLLGSAGAA
jgi:uncharacterized protein YndB with AHSA1/START domain